MLMSLMFIADLCYIFIYIIEWFLKLPVFFRSHTKYENNCNWNMYTIEQIWRKKIFLFFLKETSKSNMTVSNNSQYQALHSSMKLLVICRAFSMLINVNIPTHPILDASDMYVLANPDITTWLQSQDSLSSYVYTLNILILSSYYQGSKLLCCWIFLNKPCYYFQESLMNRKFKRTSWKLWLFVTFLTLWMSLLPLLINLMCSCWIKVFISWS